MAHAAQVVIRWRTAPEGGRAHVPRAGYRAVVRFDNDPEWRKHGAWSAVIQDIEPVDGPEVVVAYLAFLMENAPIELLRSGQHFDLMEGPKAVGRGLVLKSAEAASAA